MFVEFTLKSGARLLVNIDEIVSLEEAGPDATRLYFRESDTLVRENYDEVKQRINIGEDVTP